MPLKLSVGLSRKQGLPNFGSAGATCLVEVELSSDALKKGASFFEQAEQALEACRSVVETELARHALPVAAAPVSTPTSNLAHASSQSSSQTLSHLSCSQSAGPEVSSDMPISRERPNDRSATPRQLQAIERLTLKLGVRSSEWLYERIGDTPPHCLSLAEASALIDELQQELSSTSRLAG
jgi:hypothetical protein